jgi:hypothetical protein
MVVDGEKSLVLLMTEGLEEKMAPSRSWRPLLLHLLLR